MTLTCRNLQRLLHASGISLLLCGAILSALLSGLPPTAAAQADSTSLGAVEPTRYDDIGWHEVIFLNFESEEARRAKGMTQLCLSSTSAPRDKMPFLVETPSGPWDILMIYPLESAPLEKKWATPADLGKLRSACVEAFGDEKANATWDEYKGLIVRSSSMVGLSGRFGRPPERP